MKKLIFILFFIIFIMLFYIGDVYFSLKKASVKFTSPNNKYFIVKIKKDPIMSFGSGHTEIKLYTFYYLYLGKCVFGEFPLEITNWDIDTKSIDVKIYQHNFSNSDYVNQYVEKNKKLGAFKLNYEIIYSYP